MRTPDPIHTGATLTADQQFDLAHDRVRDALVQRCPECWSSDETLPSNLVCFDTDGDLVWGQEFLAAIVHCGTSAAAVIVQDLDVVLD